MGLRGLVSCVTVFMMCCIAANDPCFHVIRTLCALYAGPEMIYQLVVYISPVQCALG